METKEHPVSEYYSVEFGMSDPDHPLIRIDYTSKADMQKSVERLLKNGTVRRAYIYKLLGSYDADDAEEVREL